MMSIVSLLGSVLTFTLCLALDRELRENIAQLRNFRAYILISVEFLIVISL